MKLRHTVLGVISAVSLAPLAAHAGLSNPGLFNCMTNPDGSGTCFGTFMGARNSPGSGDGVQFVMYNGGYVYFTAGLGSANYFCSQQVVAGTADYGLWVAALSTRDYFQVSWDASGTCTALYLANTTTWQALPQ